MRRAADHLRSRRRFAAGSLLCPGIDPDEWAKKCQAPVYPDKWNVWRLYRTTRDNPTAKELERTADALLMQITKHVGSGKIPHTMFSIGETPPSWAEGRSVLARREDCSPVPTLAASDADPPYAVIWVRFVFRGSHSSMPWPVRKVSWIGFASACPVEADWILDRVYEPDTIDVPKEDDDPILPPALGKDLPDPKTLVPKIAIGSALVLGVVGAVAAAYVLRSFR